MSLFRKLRINRKKSAVLAYTPKFRGWNWVLMEVLCAFEFYFDNGKTVCAKMSLTFTFSSALLYLCGGSQFESFIIITPVTWYNELPFYVQSLPGVNKYNPLFRFQVLRCSEGILGLENLVVNGTRNKIVREIWKYIFVIGNDIYS